jgi:hypothetical protein
MHRAVMPKRNNSRKPGRKAVAAAVVAVVAVAVQVKTAIRANKQRPRVIPLKLKMPAVRRTQLAIPRKMMTTVATALLQRARITGGNSLKKTKRLISHRQTAIQGSHNRAIQLTRNQWNHALPHSRLHHQSGNSLRPSRLKRVIRISQHRQAVRHLQIPTGSKSRPYPNLRKSARNRDLMS